ncbi:MAG TPA: PD-(D/E)XK nuclease family protein [Nitrospinaceae bacterium]|nr:PD-(D/E)XK nuclease family protein [Nitrospinaceae bacterium]
MKNLSKSNFPTGKPHISFSEIKIWKECPWRHKLAYIDKIDKFEPSPYLDFGTAVHAGCETILEAKKVDKEKLLNEIRSAWEKNGFENPEWYNAQPGWYKHVPVDEWCSWAENMWAEIPEFLDKEFPDWECFNAEESLYETVENKSVLFKGFIDGVIKVPKKKGAGYNYWIIDWKTAGAWGWRRDKKQDLGMTAQLILYKYFWSRKHNIDIKDIRCGFILLKRGGKPGKICELVTVSVGQKTLDKGVKLMRNMIVAVEKGIYLKNRNSCKYCPYYNTDDCR